MRERPRDVREMVIRNPYDAAGAPLAPYAPVPPMGPPAAAEPQDPQIFAAILRHWWLVVLFALVGAGGALIYLQNAQKLYTSYAKIYINAGGSQLSNVLGTTQRENFLNTQCEVIRSTPLLTKAGDQLKGLKTFEGWVPAYYMQEYLEAEVGKRDDLITV